MLQEDIEDNLCSEDPWLVLHKIDSPTKMRFVGNKVAQCDPANFTTSKVAASLAHYVGPQGQTFSSLYPSLIHLPFAEWITFYILRPNWILK